MARKRGFKRLGLLVLIASMACNFSNLPFSSAETVQAAEVQEQLQPQRKQDREEPPIQDLVGDKKGNIPELTTAPTLEATVAPTPEPIVTATPEPTATLAPKSTVTATLVPAATATPEPIATVTPEPTVAATPEPTATATLTPTAEGGEAEESQYARIPEKTKIYRRADASDDFLYCTLEKKAIVFVLNERSGWAKLAFADAVADEIGYGYVQNSRLTYLSQTDADQQVEQARANPKHKALNNSVYLLPVEVSYPEGKEEPTLEPTVKPTAEPTEGEVGQTDALSAAEWLDATHPNRSIQVVPDWGECPIELGVEVTLVAHIEGYEGLETRVFWQVNRGAGWETIDDSGSLRYTFTLDAENSQWQWRAGVAVQPVE